MNYLFELLALGLIVGVCVIHAGLFNRNRIIGEWFHILWTLVYLVPCMVICLLWGSWWLAVAFIVERFVFYSVMLNLIRHKPFFYVGNAVNGSWWDKVLGSSYPYFWGASVIVYIYIQFKL